MLTAKQFELLNFIHQRLEETGISPSFEEMKDALGLKSKSGIHRLISALEERSFLRRLPNRARALEVIKLPEAAGMKSVDITVPPKIELPTTTKSDTIASIEAAHKPVENTIPVAANDVIEIPLHGRIAAGVPIEAMESHNSLAVPMALLGSGEHYALEISGDSMIEAGIFDGDYALIKRTETARDGEIIVALVRDEEATLKYLRRNGHQVQLDPANAAHEPQIYPAEDVRIQGKLAGLLRRYH